MADAKGVRTAKLSLLAAAASVVCLGQFLPADTQYAARAVTVTGRVSVLKDSQPWAISEGDLVQTQQMIVTGPDGHALFQVSDGSTFEVYPNSNVLFRRVPFNWRDLLDVLVGRVRVHIEHLGGAPNPNRVLTPTAVISVRGTTFDVAVDDAGDVTTIEVEDGQVEVQHALLPRDSPAILNPGDPPLRVYRNEPIAASSDKGTIWRYVLHAARQAATVMATRGPRSGIPGGSTGPGDSCKPRTPGCGGKLPGTGGPPPPPPPPGPPPPLVP